MDLLGYEDDTHTNGKTNGKHKIAKGTSVRIVPGTKTEQPDEITISQIEVQHINLTLIGRSPLIVNNFGTKGLQQMEDLRARTQEEKLAEKKGGKKAVTPAEIEKRFQAARVLDSKGRDCIRSAWVKGALLTAAKYKEIGIPSTTMKGAVFVEGDLLPIKFTPKSADESDDTITYYGRGPGMRRDIVRVGTFGSKQPDIRYRPTYDDWSVSFVVTFEPKLLSLNSLFHLIRRAGNSVGLCEWRPEGPGGGKGGNFGRFDVDMENFK